MSIKEKYGIHIMDIPNLQTAVKKQIVEWFESKGFKPRLWIPQEIAITGWFCPKCGIPGRAPKPKVCPVCKDTKPIDLDLLNKDTKRFVLGLATATGKTLLAMLKSMKTIYDDKMRPTGNKVLYLSPLKALATEKEATFNEQWGKDSGWKYAIKIFYLKSLTDKGYVDVAEWEREKEKIREGDLFIATYEKADIYIRNKSELFNAVKLIILDEGHIIGNNSRGPVVEMILSRIKTEYPHISILNLSATLPNIKEIAAWLSYNLGTSPVQAQGKYLGMLYDNERKEWEIWRPVKLKKGVYVNNPEVGQNTVYYYHNGKITTDKIKVIKDYNNPLVDLVVDNLTRENPGQTMVICARRSDTEDAAYLLSRAIGQYGLLEEEERDILEIIAKYYFIKKGYAKTKVEYNPNPRKRRKDDLYSLYTNGVAFHHAGLSDDLRRLIEMTYTGEILEKIYRKPRLFKSLGLDKYITKPQDIKNYKLLKVIAATTTLAAGVNLPSELVIIQRATRFDPVWGKEMKLSVREIRQMFGRAGRYGEGRALLILDVPKKAKIVTLEQVKNTPLWQRYIIGNLEQIISKLIFLKDHRIYNQYYKYVASLDEIYQFVKYEELTGTMEEAGANFDSSNLIKQLLGSIYMYGEDGIPLNILGSILQITYYIVINVRRAEILKNKIIKITKGKSIEEVKGEVDKETYEFLLNAKEQQKIYLFLNEKLFKETSLALNFLVEKEMIYRITEEIGEEILGIVISDFGKKVARLYLDPVFAGYAHESIDRFNEEGADEFRFLHLLSMEESVQPPYIPSTKVNRIFALIPPGTMYIDPPDPNVNYPEFERYCKAYLTAIILEDWIAEYPIQYIVDKHNLYESDLNRKSFGTQRLANIYYALFEELKMEYRNFCRIMGIRIRYGVRTELANLCSIEGIGRVRGRQLYSAGFKTPLFIVFSFITITTVKKRGKREKEILKSNIDIIKDKQEIKKNPSYRGHIGTIEKPLGWEIYNIIEKIITDINRAPTISMIKSKLFGKRWKLIGGNEKEDFERVINELIEDKYIRKTDVPVLEKKKDPKKGVIYEWNTTTRYVPHNDALVVSSVVGKGWALNIYKNIVNNSRYIEIIEEITKALLNIIKGLQKRKEEVTEENVLKIFRTIRKGAKKILVANDEEIEFIVNRILRILKEKGKMPEIPKEEPSLIPIEIVGSDLDILEIIVKYESEALSSGLTSPKDILPTREEIISAYILETGVTKNEAERIVDDAIQRLLNRKIAIYTVIVEGERRTHYRAIEAI